MRFLPNEMATVLFISLQIQNSSVIGSGEIIDGFIIIIILFGENNLIEFCNFRGMIISELSIFTLHWCMLFSELSLITLHWFLTVFASVVHTRVLLKLWDLFFYEGSIILFQMTLGMLKMKVIRDDRLSFCKFFYSSSQICHCYKFLLRLLDYVLI